MRRITIAPPCDARSTSWSSLLVLLVHVVACGGAASEDRADGASAPGPDATLAGPVGGGESPDPGAAGELNGPATATPEANGPSPTSLPGEDVAPAATTNEPNPTPDPVTAGGAGSVPDPPVGAGGNPAVPTTGGFTVDVTTSTAIPTVGIVTWSVDATVESATILFGRDQNAFEYQAPVDLAQPDYRTLLLGMKPDTTYYVQVVAESGGSTLTSDVVTVETGFLPNGLPVLAVNDVASEALYGGFTINCTGVATGGFGFPGGGESADSYVFVFDRDGDMVWAYDITDTDAAECSRARMSYDGAHMWVGNFSNVSPTGVLMRVSMDGLSETESYSFPGRHHDFSILPNGHVLFHEQENGGGYTGDSEGPDIIRELDPETGEATTLYHENTDFEQQIIDAGGAHTNHINYVPELDAISFSLRHSSTIALISYPDASLLAVFGGPNTDFAEMTWDVQHGHQVLADRLLVFNNNGTNGGSDILEFEFDLAAGTSSQIMNYSSGNSSGAFGDVKRLPNGNTFVTYSTSGVIHEIDSNQELLREITTDSIGYSEHRKTLYGPPPPFGP